MSCKFCSNCPRPHCRRLRRIHADEMWSAFSWSVWLLFSKLDQKINTLLLKSRKNKPCKPTFKLFLINSLSGLVQVDNSELLLLLDFLQCLVNVQGSLLHLIVQEQFHVAAWLVRVLFEHVLERRIAEVEVTIFEQELSLGVRFRYELVIVGIFVSRKTAIKFK